MRKKLWKLTGAFAFSLLLAGTAGGTIHASETDASEPAAEVQTQAGEMSDRDLKWVDRGDAVNVGDDYEWEGVIDDDGTVMITGSNTLDWASDGVLEIPAEVGGMTVDSVGGYLSGFGIMSPEVITTIKFPNTVTYIESGAFSNFGNLTTVYLPDNKGYGGIDSWDNPFEGCTKIETVYANSYSLDHDDLRNSLRTITYYDGVTEVDGTPYYDIDTWANLTTVNLPASIERFGWKNAPELSALNCSKPISQIIVTSTHDCPKLCIPVNAGTIQGITDDYQNSGITQLTMQFTGEPSYNTKDAFINCPNLQAINVTDPAGEFHSEDGVLWWNNDLWTYPAGKSWAGNYDVPGNVECIYLYAFDSCKFTTLTFPENVNPEFYWDRYDTQMNPRDSILENTSITKVRAVSGSKVTYIYSTEEELADRLGIDASQVEFYLGNTYQISYELDGGTNAPGNPTSYRAGEDPVTLQDPTKEGYVFLGWKRNDVAEGYENTTERAYDGYFGNYTFTACWAADLPFADVGPDTWFNSYVANVYEKGIMTGLSETSFGALDNLARAQFALILYRMNDEPAVTFEQRFHDVPANIWYTDAVLWASNEGVVTGYSNGNFGPGDNINREQMAVMMYRYANSKGYDTSQKADISQFNDASRVSDFAQEAMEWAYGTGIITGKYNETALEPQGNATRAECATIITRFLDQYGE